MWFDIVLWVVLIATVLWVLKKSGVFLMIAERASRNTYNRLSPEEKDKWDTIIEEESRKDINEDQNH